MEEEIYDEEEAEEKLAEEEDYGEEAQPECESTISLNEVERDTCVLTHAEAGECLHNLGKCVTQYEYAYLSLDASDRGLTNISVIASFKHVRYVNVSENRLTSEALCALETIPYLQTLRADRNCLTSMELKPMPYLQELTLNWNKLTDTSGIRHKSLERLELNHNDIRTVNVDPQILVNLRTLELRGNALVSTAGICCPGLTRLFLAENQIEKIENLGVLVNLTTLHLRSNKLANLDGFTKQCRSLNYVNLRDNELPRISELKKLNCLPNLEILIVLGNPLLREEKEEKEYRRIILTMLPKLKRIDKDPVLDQERNEAKELLKKIQKSESKYEGFDLRD
ncbi:PREDICTED: leucine-rich repeat-containing protein 23-like [Trachymyrmex cornetzi]|uniref:Leucine-rich repeat-containing protein 23 n=1 Tax=Trachymyrmex cornetzi TaxID=471704 RepID=A0A195EIP7_9HYME|nr:PREDICTED: leucine-rich repeat-containing protein 23-like [Trachymyrmex cornetzi]XP_018378217.1 PREDICTED: leucine-rich repeat-containing protein 23-like [Trachymyrmex cornetzi]KYN27772.1 Leucine-rich repeat-containing protein 23 [Trachymyrmex cornetzi]